MLFFERQVQTGLQDWIWEQIDGTVHPVMIPESVESNFNSF